MDVDVDNFEEALAVLLGSLPSASFVALDLEMTGINLGQGNDESPKDTVEQRYTKRRRAAASYGIIQVGLCLFEREPAQASTRSASGDAAPPADYLARPFNFFIFPRPVNEPPDCYISPKITLDADAMHFVRCSGADFGRWMSKGIPFLDRPGEDAFNAALAKRLSPPFAGPQAKEKPADEVAKREARGIEEVSGGSFGKGASYFLQTHGSKHLPVLQAMRERRPGDHIVLERRAGPLGGCRQPQVTIRNLGSDAVALQAWREEETHEVERISAAHVGLRRVWKALLQSGRPLIMHNGFLDLLYAFHWLEEPLPVTLEEFKSTLRRTLAAGTKIYDTKWMAHFTDRGRRLGHENRSSLEQLSRLVERQSPGGVGRFTCPKGFERFGDASPAYHDAAYDALCTGKLFAYFSQGAEEGFLQEAAVPGPRAAEERRPSGCIAAPANRYDCLASSESSDASSAGSEVGVGGKVLPQILADSANRIFLMFTSQDLSWDLGALAPRKPSRPGLVVPCAPNGHVPASTAAPLSTTPAQLPCLAPAAGPPVATR